MSNIDSFELVRSHSSDVPRCFGAELTGDQIQVARIFEIDIKRVIAEMGGKNAILVMEDADLDLAVDGAIWGGFGTTGQRCTAASRVIVDDRVYREFVERFVARARALRVGNGLEPDVDMGPTVNEAQLATVASYVDVGKGEGATLACGGHRLEAGAFRKGWFHEPTIFTDVAPEMRIAREEIFGPVLSVLTFRTPEEAVEKANNTSYGLSAGIWTDKGARILWCAERMKAGEVLQLVSDCSAAVEEIRTWSQVTSVELLADFERARNAHEFYLKKK